MHYLSNRLIFWRISKSHKIRKSHEVSSRWTMLWCELFKRIYQKIYHRLDVTVTFETSSRNMQNCVNNCQLHISPVKLMLHCFFWRLVAVKWRSHRLSQHEIKVSLKKKKKKVFILIKVQWWNADALPGWGLLSCCQRCQHRWRSHRPAAAKRKQRRSDYSSGAEWMNRPELRAARRFSEASTSTSVWELFTWSDINVLIVNFLNDFTSEASRTRFQGKRVRAFILQSKSLSNCCGS